MQSLHFAPAPSFHNERWANHHADYHGLKQTCHQLQSEFGPLIDRWNPTVVPFEEVVAYLDTFHPAQDASPPDVRKANLLLDLTPITSAFTEPDHDTIDIVPYLRVLASSATRDFTVGCLNTRGASEIIQIIYAPGKFQSLRGAKTTGRSS